MTHLRLLRALRRLLLAIERRINRPSTMPNPMGLNRLTEQTIREHLMSLDVEAKGYLKDHLERLVRTIQLIPEPSESKAEALELGAYGHLAAILEHELGYRVRGAYLGPVGHTDRRVISARGVPVAQTEIDLFDAELDVWPYDRERFEGVLACEVFEHLVRDPMWLLWEANRVLRLGGWLLLTTPNCASYRSLEQALLRMENPQIFARYNQQTPEDRPHVREYTFKELNWAVAAAGFRVEGAETVREANAQSYGWLEQMLVDHGLPTTHRGEQIYCLARKASEPVERYPKFLYA